MHLLRPDSQIAGPCCDFLSDTKEPPDSEGSRAGDLTHAAMELKTGSEKGHRPLSPKCQEKLWPG